MSHPADSGRGFLARNTVLNIAGQGIPLLVAVATIPYVVRGLGPERFGILSVAWLVLGYFALLDFGLGRAATKFIAECLARRELERLPGLLWTSLGLQLLMGGGGALLLAILTPALAGRVFHVQPGLRSEASHIFLALALSLPALLATSGLRAALEAAQRFDLVNYLRIPGSMAAYVVPAAGLRLGASLLEIVLLMVLFRFLVSFAHLVCCLAVFPAIRQVCWNRHDLPSLVRYGGWVTVSNLVNPVLLYADRFLVGALLSLSLLGYYAVPFEAVTKLWIIPTSLASTLFPAFSALTATSDPSRLTLLYARSFKYLLLLLGPVILLLVVFARDILTLWMGEAFARPTTSVLQILACGVFVNCFAHIPFGLLQSHGRPDLAAKVLLCELPLYLPLAWFAVRHGGIAGAAAGWTLRVAIELLVFCLLVSKVFGLDGRAFAEHGVVKSLLGIAALGVGLVAAKLFFRDSLPAQLAASMGLTAAFCGLVWRNVLDRADRGQVQGMFAPVLHAVKGWVPS
jgi:O-antigen/teichoic acid export membrane protein